VLARSPFVVENGRTFIKVRKPGWIAWAIDQHAAPSFDLGAAALISFVSIADIVSARPSSRQVVRGRQESDVLRLVSKSLESVTED
jgi:hypothetical protein